MFAISSMTLKNIDQAGLHVEDARAECAAVSSTRNGIRSSVPSGQTVSKWPSTRAGRRAAGPGESSRGRGRPRGVADRSRPRCRQRRNRSARSPRQRVERRPCRGWATRARPAPRAVASITSCVRTETCSSRSLSASCDLLHACQSKASRSVRASIRSSIGSTPRPGPSNTAIAPRCGQDRRLDDVLGVVLVRAGDVAGERESGQARRSPRWPPGRCRTRASRRTRPARRAPGRGRGRASPRAGRPARLTLMLITRQAPRSRALRASSAEWMLSSRQIGVFKRRLEPGVVDDVVVRQRLLDQEQVEVVERLERGQVVERVRRVGVDLERRSSGYRSRTRRTTSTSQPGAILSLIRRYPSSR